MVLFTRNKARIQITQEEANSILAKKKAGVQSDVVRGMLVDLMGIEILTDAAADDKNVGRLHDGTRVVRSFGIWKDAENPDVHLDHDYYPELRKDQVLTEGQYLREVATLPSLDGRKSRYRELASKDNTQPRLTGGSTQS